jgi:hypothetical protein
MRNVGLEAAELQTSMGRVENNFKGQVHKLKYEKETITQSPGGGY